MFKEVAPTQAAITDQYIVILNDQVISGQQKKGEAYVQSMVTSIEGLLEVQSLKTFSHTIKGGVFQLSLADVELLKNMNEVLLIEKDDFISIDNFQLSPPYNLDRIDQSNLPLDGSHSLLSGGSEVHAYVLDTGVQISHNEFEDRGREGFDFVGNDSIANDCNGHGTHVAGTLAGKTYGAAKNVKVVGVRVLGCGGSGRFSDVISGIEWVTRNHIKPAVANMSLGGGISTSIDLAVRASINSGVTYVVAAGNESSNACNKSPARLAEAITVGSTTRDDDMSSFSNFGECVDIFAPGSNILSAWIGSNSRTRTISGTSMATPLVAGVVAVHLSQNPQSTPQQVKDAILGNALIDKLRGLRGDSPNLLLSAQYLIGEDVEEPDDGGDDKNLDDNILEDGEVIEGLAQFQSQESFYEVVVDESVDSLRVQIRGGSGDADLYVRFGEQPTRFSYQCRPFRVGNNEVCEILNPLEGTYHIMLRAFDDYKEVELSVSID